LVFMKVTFIYLCLYHVTMGLFIMASTKNKVIETLAILKISNEKINVSKIAKDLGVSRTTVRYHIDNIKKKKVF